MGFISADRGQLDMLGYSIDELVEEDCQSRQIVSIVEQLDLSGLYADYSTQGGDAMDPTIMLAVWFLAYFEGITSTRKVEALCRRDLQYIYVSANLRPDHCSLSRFRKRHIERLPALFVQLVKLAQQKGLAAFERLSMDGSKLEAAASSRNNCKAKELEEQLRKARSDIEAYLEECAAEDSPVEEAKIEKLQERQAHLEGCQQTLELRKAELQPKDRDKHAVNTAEPEARSMAKVNGKIAAPAYNAQIVVDERTQTIASCQLCDHPNDRQQFASLHAGCEQVLGSDPKRQYTADSGYHSFEQLEYIQSAGVDAIIAEPRPDERRACSKGQGKFRRGEFTYDVRSDCYICPAGKILPHRHRERRRGRLVDVYRAEHCPGCPLRARCLTHPEKPAALRLISRDTKEHLAEEMFERSSSKQGRQRLKRRAQSVEPAFGNLKANIGFRRFSLRGLNQAAGEFALMCIAHNLRKWLKQTHCCGQMALDWALAIVTEAFRAILAVTFAPQRHAEGPRSLPSLVACP